MANDLIHEVFDRSYASMEIPLVGDARVREVSLDDLVCRLHCVAFLSSRSINGFVI